jgi:hypothetical protein
MDFTPISILGIAEIKKCFQQIMRTRFSQIFLGFAGIDAYRCPSMPINARELRIESQPNFSLHREPHHTTDQQAPPSTAVTSTLLPPPLFHLWWSVQRT